MTTSKVVLLLSLTLVVSGVPLNPSDKSKAEDVDQLVSGTNVAKTIASIPIASAEGSAKGDLKTSDSFGLGYYLPIVTPALVKYHYPLLYYPTAYLHSIRHHGYGGYGFYHGHHGVLH